MHYLSLTNVNLWYFSLTLQTQRQNMSYSYIIEYFKAKRWAKTTEISFGERFNFGLKCELSIKEKNRSYFENRCLNLENIFDQNKCEQN